MPTPTRPFTLNTRLAIPAVLSAAVIAGVLTSRSIGAKPHAVKTVTPAMVASGTVTLDTLLSLMPDAFLQALPDPGTKTASAREVARWRDAARKETNDPKNWVNLGDALMQRSRELVDPHYYDYAHVAYTIALKRDPKNADATQGMAWVCGGRHQFDKSIDYANQAIALNPNNAAPYGLIGDAQVEMGDYEDAFTSYQKMLDIRPDTASYSRGAHLLFLTGNTRKALQLMTMAVKAGGAYTENSAWCQAQLADMLWQSGNLLAADFTIQGAVKVAPENYYVQTALGHIRESRGDLAGAEAAYQKAITISPQHAALVALGDLYLYQGKKAEAERVFEQVETAHAHHQQHGSHDAYYMAAFYADHDRKVDQALKIIESRAPKSPLDHEIAATVFCKVGRLEDARKEIDLALQKGTPLAVRFFHAGMIYARAGERNKAQRLLNDALAKNPHFSILQVKQATDTLYDLGSRSPSGQVALAK